MFRPIKCKYKELFRNSWGPKRQRIIKNIFHYFPSFNLQTSSTKRVDKETAGSLGQNAGVMAENQF